MPTYNPTAPHLVSLEMMRNRACDVAARAKSMADNLRVEYARQVLQSSFPDHTQAVFGRAWDEDEPRLLQILSNRPDIDDVDLRLSNPAALPKRKQASAYIAENEIAAIGSDEDILAYLDAGNHEHDGWYEFQLTLHH